MNRPWLKFYPADWRADPRLRMCSYAARGLWIDLISYMHEGEPYGHLAIDGVQPDLNGIAALTGRPVNETRKTLAELEAKQVFSRAASGAIFSRRMVRDKAKSEKDEANGKAGGNPILTLGVNPPDKAHIPEPRGQKESKPFNGNGKAKGWTPPPHGATGNGRIYIQAGSEEWKAYAEDFKAIHCREPEPNRHGGKWFKVLGEATDVFHAERKTG